MYRDVLRRERLRDYVVLPGQKSAAFSMRLATGMPQELPKHFAPTLHHSPHSGSVQQANSRSERRRGEHA